MYRGHYERRCNCLLVIYCNFGYNASNRFDLARTGISTCRTVRERVPFRVLFRVHHDLALVKNVFVSRQDLRFPLRGAVKAMYGPFLFAAL